MIFKILEAMSYGIPVVSTTVANEGIMATEDKDILTANTPAAFAEKITLLLNDPEQWKEQSAQGYEFVKAHFSWEKIMDGYLACCERALRR